MSTRAVLAVNRIKASVAGFLVSAAVSLAFPLVLGLRPVYGLPQAEVDKTLGVIGVYVPMKKDGDKVEILFSVQGGGEWYAPVYLSKKDAEDYLAQLKRSVPNGGQVLVPVSLYDLNNLIAGVRKAQPDKAILTPIVSPRAERQDAEALLIKKGLTAKEVAVGLKVPVFFVEPMIQVETNNGPRKLFFFSKEQLESKVESELSAVQQKSLNLNVADLNVVLSMMLKAEKAEFAFFPNPVYLEEIKR